ncbi:MAG: LysM peptidoglycan-binding domain-containing protein [Prevotellaceae bacterium]|nr:LysM peptidoglycan-binding domain-containing protein [Prevotellaceae bacterium]
MYKKNAQLSFVVFLFLTLFLFLHSDLYSQINEKALFNNVVTNVDTAMAKPAETVNMHQETVYTQSPKDVEYKPYDEQNNIKNSSSLSLINRALQDTTGIVLLDEEELPPADMPDSVYIRRLSALPAIISLPYNNIVRNCIVYYVQKYPNRSETILGLCNYYLPIFEEILDSYNIPLEMKALPIIESALNPVAVSRAGATGMWQFMLGTGKRYDLTVNTYVDERRDFIASTHAAAKYLNGLYSMFQDWTLALAAYNCGEGNVMKAIARAEGKRDYWEIYPYLPRETRNYVPQFIAANYLISYYKEHRLTPKEITFTSAIDTFMVSSNLHLEQVSKTIDIPMNLLRDLNPQYKRDIIPGNEKPYELRIPSEYTLTFIENEKKIYEQGNKYFKTDIVVKPITDRKKDDHKTKNQSSANAKKSTKGALETGQQTVHKVVAGESLGSIAAKYGIKVSDLNKWNKLAESATIYPGQKLLISGKKTDSKPTTGKQTGTKYYTIKSGDSLWGIAQQNNLQFEELLKINNMTKNSKLVPGQKIIIQK